MAYKLLTNKLMEIQSEKSAPEYKCEYLCDTEADVQNLPNCAPSSTAIVIESGSVYMVNTAGEWVKFGG